MNEEIWKAIPGYEGFYEVSPKGNFRGLDRFVSRSNGRGFSVKGIPIKKRISDKGYGHVILGRGNKDRFSYV